MKSGNLNFLELWTTPGPLTGTAAAAAAAYIKCGY
jgi:hypothetical protein